MVSVDDVNLAAGQRRVDGVDIWRHVIGPASALLDAAVVIATVLLASTLYHLAAYDDAGRTQTVAELALMIATIFVLANAMRGRYQLGNHLSHKGQIGAACSIWTITIVTFVGLLFVGKFADHYSRAVVLLSYLAGIPLIALARSAFVLAVLRAGRAGLLTAQRIFLVGGKAEVQSFISRHRPSALGLSIVDVAFLDGTEAAADLAAAAARCRHAQPDAVFIAASWSDQRTIDTCVDAFMNLPVAIHLTAEKIIDRFDAPHIERVGTLASLRLTRMAQTNFDRAVKRAFDIVLAIVILMVTVPLLLTIAAAIRFETRGPVLFLQRRNGFNQRAFRILKFRSMITTDDGAIIRQATRNDPRVTRVGAILRRTNLDELPQLLNVIAGDMSLVGPRPHALAHDDEYQRKIVLYARRHNVKPGITGWAQVNGLRGETDTDDKMARRIELDHWYIENWSFWLDLVILARTVCSAKAYSNAA